MAASSTFLEAKAYTEHSQGDRVCFFHSHEWSLGTMTYYFPEAPHVDFDSTFMVRTYDVFPVEVVDIGSIDNIWNYTDKCYILTSMSNLNMEGKAQDILDFFDQSNDCEVVSINDYTMGYPCVSKNYNMSEVIYR